MLPDDDLLLFAHLSHDARELFVTGLPDEDVKVVPRLTSHVSTQTLVEQAELAHTHESA